MAEITYKALKEGDRVMVEIVGVLDAAGWLIIGDATAITPDALSHSKITLLEPELKVGRAEHKATGDKGYVLHIDGDETWFRYDSGGQGFVPVKDLRNIPEEDV